MKPLLSLALILVLCAILAPLGAPYDPVAQDRHHTSSPPTRDHWLGTDEFGRDLLSRFLTGAGWSVSIGLGATIVVMTLGWIIGGIAGYAGGWLDRILMQLSELFLVLPWLYLLVAVHAILPTGLPPRGAFALLLFLIAIVSWAQPARLVRGLVLSLTAKGYVAAAQSFGVPGWKIFLHHIFPDTLPLLLLNSLLALPRFVLAEVTLSFLGLGAGEPEPSWGALILPLKQLYLFSDQWWRLLPPLLMAPFFLCFAILAYRVREHTGTLR